MSDVYDLAPRPVTPKLTGTVVVRESAEELIDSIAADLLIHASNCIRAFGDFHLALSGGSTPIPLYQRLMYDPNYREFPWAKTQLWIVDERRVPFDDERSNFKLINELIGMHSGIPENQVHPIEAVVENADVKYEQEIRDTLGWREPGQDRLDFVLLGLGNDGHTASLFPRSPALEAELSETDQPGKGLLGGRLYRTNAGANVTPPDRVTMTLRMINASRFVGVMVTGTSKREMVAKVAESVKFHRQNLPRRSIVDLPILGVRPAGGELRWYLDRAACPTESDKATA